MTRADILAELPDHYESVFGIVVNKFNLVISTPCFISVQIDDVVNIVHLGGSIFIETAGGHIIQLTEGGACSVIFC